MVDAVGHVVVFVQENHTTDNYFRSMRAWGANVADDWPIQPNPPLRDHAHTRAAYAKWLHAQQAGAPTPAVHAQFDTTSVLPYYAYLAATGAFLENHCSGFGTNSTPNHLLLVGGQTPTLRNPPRNQPDPVWDMPSILGHAGDHGLSWKAYTGTSSYPVAFYQQLKGLPNIVRSDQIDIKFTGGKEADFQLFMGLLDADRFEGRFREGVHKADVTDMMRRMTKEELYRFDKGWYATDKTCG